MNLNFFFKRTLYHWLDCFSSPQPPPIASLHQKYTFRMIMAKYLIESYNINVGKREQFTRLDDSIFDLLLRNQRMLMFIHASLTNCE